MKLPKRTSLMQILIFLISTDYPPIKLIDQNIINTNVIYKIF